VHPAVKAVDTAGKDCDVSVSWGFLEYFEFAEHVMKLVVPSVIFLGS
jgi:hypothetical protein